PGHAHAAGSGNSPRRPVSVTPRVSRVTGRRRVEGVSVPGGEVGAYGTGVSPPVDAPRGRARRVPRRVPPGSGRPGAPRPGRRPAGRAKDRARPRRPGRSTPKRGADDRIRPPALRVPSRSRAPPVPAPERPPPHPPARGAGAGRPVRPGPGAEAGPGTDLRRGGGVLRRRPGDPPGPLAGPGRAGIGRPVPADRK